MQSDMQCKNSYSEKKPNNQYWGKKSYIKLGDEIKRCMESNILG